MKEFKTTISGLVVFCLVFFGAHAYSLLSGINHITSLVFASIGVSILYVAYKIGEVNYGLINHGNKEAVPYRGGMGFWFIVTVFLAPVIINLIARLVKWCGYEVAYVYIHEFRFWGMLFVTIACIAAYTLTRWLIFRYRRFRERLGVGIIERGTV